MYETMKEVYPDMMVNNTQQGLDAVQNSNGEYAFLWDNTGEITRKYYITVYMCATTLHINIY